MKNEDDEMYWDRIAQQHAAFFDALIERRACSKMRNIGGF